MAGSEMKTNISLMQRLGFANINNARSTNRLMDYILRKVGFADRSLVAERLNAGSLNPAQIEAHRDSLLRHGILHEPVERPIQATDIRRCVTPERLLGLQNELEAQLGFESMILELQNVGRIKGAIQKVTDVIFGIEYSLEVVGRISDFKPSGDYLGDQGIIAKLNRELLTARGYVLSLIGNEEGFAKPKTAIFLAMLAGGLSLAYVAKSHAPALYFAGGLFSATAILGLLLRNPKSIYRAKRALPSVLVTAGALLTRFLFIDRNNVEWAGSAVTLGIILGSFMLHGLFRRYRESKRHEALNSIRPDQIAQMSEVRNFLEVFYRAKWEGWDIDTLKQKIKVLKPEKQEAEYIEQNKYIKNSILKRLLKTNNPEEIEKTLKQQLAYLVREVPGYRFPSFSLIALFKASRIYSVLFYFPLCALFLSRGYSPEIAMVFTAFWVAQMIYGPTGIRFMDLLEVGELSEPLRYGDLDPDDIRLIPRTKLIRLSLRGLGREGKVPIFLVRDIINAIFTGYRVKIFIGEDAKNLYYPEAAGAVANAKILEAKVYAINKMFISEIPEIDNLDRMSKVILLRLFLKENLWDATHEFDHAINSAYKGSWPSEKSNKLFNKHGDEAGDRTCAKALKRLMEENAKAGGSNAKIFKRIAEIIEDYATKETQVTLQNIFDDEYMKLACAVLAARIGLYPDETKKSFSRKKAKFDAVVENIFKAIKAGREKALIEEYYKLAQEVKIPKDRAWHIAIKLIEDIQKEIKIEELTAIMDKLVARAKVENEEKRKLIKGISGIFGISQQAAENFIKLVEENDIAKLAAYLAERPITPEDFHASLRDLAILLLYFERPDSEDGNIIPFYYHVAQKSHQLSPHEDISLAEGQQRILELISDAVICKNLDMWIKDIVTNPKMREEIVNKYIETGDLNAALSGIKTEDVKEKIVRLVHQKLLEANPKGKATDSIHNCITAKLDTGNTGIFVARKIQAQFKMERIFFNANERLERLYFLINGLSKGLFPTFSKLLPERKYEYLAKWLDKLGTEIAIKIAEEQLFSFDYYNYIDKKVSRNGICRDTAEDIVFEKWLEGLRIKDIVYDVIESMFVELKSKFTKKLTVPEKNIIKYKIWKIIKEELENNKNMVNSVTTGLEWIMVHGMPGIKYLSEEVRKNPKESKLAAFIAEYFPKKEGAPPWRSKDKNSPFISKLKLDSPFAFLDSLPGTLEELREINIELIEKLRQQIKKRLGEDVSDKVAKKIRQQIKKGSGKGASDGVINEKAKAIIDDIKGLIDKGVSNFWRTKGYLNALWDLTWELPEIVLGRKGKYLSFYEKRRLLQIEGGEAKNFNEKYAYLDDKKGKMEDLLREIVAVRAKMMSIRKELRYHLLAVKNPELLYGAVIEGYTATFLSKNIVDAFIERGIEDLGKYMEEDIAKKFIGAYMSEAGRGVWGSNDPGHIFKPIFTRKIREADALIKSGEMRILNEGDLT